MLAVTTRGLLNWVGVLLMVIYVITLLACRHVTTIKSLVFDNIGRQERRQRDLAGTTAYKVRRRNSAVAADSIMSAAMEIRKATKHPSISKFVNGIYLKHGLFWVPRPFV